MSRPVHVTGVGMLPFTKPGSGPAYLDLGAAAARAALDDAGVDYHSIEQVYAGYVYGDSCSGQAAAYRLGLTSVPIFNVNNNCASGSTALFLGRQAIASGAAECVLIMGFEQVDGDAIAARWPDRPDPAQTLRDTMHAIQGTDAHAPVAAQMFAGAARMHMQLYGTRADTFARIAVKARAHAGRNPNAMFRTPLSLEEVMASPMVFDPLTRYQCCPRTSGGAAVVLCSADFARRRGLDVRVTIAAQAMVTDGNSSFDERDMRKLVGYDMTRRAAAQVYEMAGVGPQDIAVVELQDSFSVNELITYEALGLCAEGEAERFVLGAQNTHGGRVVTNPSGGLLSNGDPHGATGLAQCAELVWQLRNQAGDRQVPDARFALQHNLGLGGACVVTLFERA